MSNLVAIGYPDTAAAEAALQELARAQKEMLIQLDDAVIVERRLDGKVKLHQSRGSTAAMGATGGALWGGLIGLIFLAPLLGMAVGAAAGGAAGKLSDVGIDDNFMKGLGAQLSPGNAALVLLVREATWDKLLERMHGQYGGQLLQSSLSTEQEDHLRAAATAAAHASHS